MMNRVNRIALSIAGLLMAAAASAEYGLNMPEGVTDFSQNVFHLHMLIFWICVVIGVLVFGVMLYSIVKFRKSKGAEPATFSHSTKAEIIWTVIPILILVAMAVPSTKSLIELDAPQDMDMTIKITGYQWKWKYEYLDEGFGFLSTLKADSNQARQVGAGVNVNTVDNYLLDVDKRLVIPANTNVRFLLTSDDVIHSWWVPDFGWKRDAIPGFINQAWTHVKEPGVYRGQCAELCGKDHGFMPVVVEVLSKEDYATWVAAQKGEQQAVAVMETQEWSREDLLEKGQQVYNSQCAACHQANGQGMPPAFPSLAGNAVVNGDPQVQIDVVVNGRPGTAMQAFGNLLSASDIAAAITYTRNSWGNAAGDAIQPADVKQVKEG